MYALAGSIQGQRVFCLDREQQGPGVKAGAVLRCISQPIPFLFGDFLLGGPDIVAVEIRLNFSTLVPPAAGEHQAARLLEGQLAAQADAQLHIPGAARHRVVFNDQIIQP